MVLALDDLHWAGPAAVQLLSRVVEGTADARVLFLGTLRNAPPDRSDALADTLASLSRRSGVLRIELSPFTTEEIADYVAIRAGITHSDARESAEVLGELTGGNPFLLRAMWRPVVEAERRGDQRVIELPDSVGDLVRSRIAMLQPPQRSVLELAAVLGQEVDLSEVIGMSAASVDVTLAAMDAAVRVGLIEPPRTAGDLTASRTPSRGRPSSTPSGHGVAAHPCAHRAGARIGLPRGTAAHPAPRPPLLGRPRAGVRRSGGDLPDPGRRARGRSICVRGRRPLFERASVISPDRDEQAELLLRAAGDWDLAADTAQARARYEQVAETADPRMRLRAAIGYEDASWRPGLLGHRALELLSAGLASIPQDDDDPLYVEALGALARATAFIGAVDEGERIGDRAVEPRPRDRRSLGAGIRTPFDRVHDASPQGDREAAGTRDRAARPDPIDAQRVDGRRDAERVREQLSPR